MALELRPVPEKPTDRVPMNIPVTDMPKITPLTPLALAVMAASRVITKGQRQ